MLYKTLDRKNDRLVISTRKFGNSKYLDIRSYFYKNGEFNPSLKGITIKSKEELEFLMKTLSENENEIMNWICKDAD